MAFKELVSPTLTELFTKEIERMILSGELKIGQKLPTERELSEQMKVSRAVINNGINKLARTGFLRIAPRKGVYVTDYVREGTIDTLTAILEYNGWRFTPELLDPILQFRSGVDPFFTELAALNAKPEHIEKLLGIVDEIKTCEDSEKFSELGFTFYHTVAVASCNIIWPIITRTFKPAYTSIIKVLFGLGYKEEICESFGILISHLRSGRVEAAKAHILLTNENGISWLQSHYNPGDLF